MVHFKHGSKYPVVILTKHLRYNELEYTERTPYNQVIEFTHRLGFFHSGRIENLLHLYSPALAGHESGDEILGREVTTELRVSVHLKSAQFCQSVFMQFAAISTTCSVQTSL